MTEELNKSRWRFDPTLVPGPDRSQIPYVKDVVLESPSGQMAAAVYSIKEVLNNWYVGLLAILCGDPASPQIRLLPKEFGCTPTLRWLGSDRYLSVQMSMYHRASKRHDIPFCLFDLDLQLHTFYPFRNPCATIESESGQWIVREWERAKAFPPHDGEIVSPQSLRWLPWTELDRHHENYFAGVFGRV